MDIKTKFDIEDNVFFMFENKIVQGCIEKIFCSIVNKTDKFVVIEYDMNSMGMLIRRHEKNIFLTKEELLKTL